MNTRSGFDVLPLQGAPDELPEVTKGPAPSGAFFEVSPDGLGIGRGSGLTTGGVRGYSSLAQHSLRAATCPLSTLAAAN